MEQPIKGSPDRKDYDLMQLIIIRLGRNDYRSEGQDVLEFLSVIFYPHGPGFRKTISKYIDLNTCLEKEATDGMFHLNEWFYQDGMEAGIEQGMERGIEQGIEAFILDNLEEHISEDRIINKLQRRFHLSKESAAAYFEKYAFAEV